MSSKEGSKDEETAVSQSSLSVSFTDANIKIEPSDNFLQVICKLEESTVSQESSEESNSLIDADSRKTPEELMIIPPTEIEEIYFDDHLDNFSSISIRRGNHQYAPNIFTMCRYFVKKKLPLPHTHQVLVSQTNGGTIKQENEEQKPGEFKVDKNIGAVGDNSPLLGFEDLPCEDHNEAKIRQDSLKGNTPEHLNSSKIFAALKVKKHLEILGSSTIKQNEASISYEKEEKTSANEVIIGSPAKKTIIKVFNIDKCESNGVIIKSDYGFDDNFYNRYPFIPFHSKPCSKKNFLGLLEGEYYSSIKRLVSPVSERFQCKHCNKIFKSWSTIFPHTTSKICQNPYLCDICGKIFRHQSTFALHSKCHTAGSISYRCSICLKSFQTQSALASHYRYRHISNSGYLCYICGKMFVSQTKLSKHINHEHANGSFKCEHCSKIFRREKLKIIHIKRVHFKDYSYSCLDCGKLVSSRRNLRRHIKIHSGDKRFQCEYCCYTFIQRSNYLLHLRTKSCSPVHCKDSPFSCDQSREPYRPNSCRLLKTSVNISKYKVSYGLYNKPSRC